MKAFVKWGLIAAGAIALVIALLACSTEAPQVVDTTAPTASPAGHSGHA